MRSTLNLIKGDRIGIETDYRDALPVNMSVVMKPILGADGYMLQFPGLTQYATGTGIGRQAVWNERQVNHYRVSGQRFISVEEDGTVSDIGAITGTDTASMPYSFNSQAIIADGKMWLYDGVNLSQVTDPDLGSPIDSVWVDSYYMLTDGAFLYHTDLQDESSIDPLKFATAEFSPDPTLGLGKTQDNKVIAFGRYSVEYLRNVATDNFAFTRLADRAQKIGIVGTHCKVEIASQWYILGGRKDESVSVHVLGVGLSKKIATREIDKIIGTYTETELAGSVLETYEEDGYTYLIIHLPNHTLMFNVTFAEKIGIDQAWTLLKTDVLGDNPWRGKFGIFEPRRGEWVFGDRASSNIGILDETVTTHYGELAEWLLFTPLAKLDGQSIDELSIETIPGHTSYDDATVAVSLTYDGITYGQEWWELYGEPTAYQERFVIRRLGHVRDWFGGQLRGASRSRMAFGLATIDHG